MFITLTIKNQFYIKKNSNLMLDFNKWSINLLNKKR